MSGQVIESWHQFMQQGRDELLDDLLADDVTFYSPAVHKPKQGRATVAPFLRAAEHLFAGTDFRHVAQWTEAKSAVLEFVVEIDGVDVEGVDIIHWNDSGQITSFKVMVRPFRALEKVMKSMGEALVETGAMTAATIALGRDEGAYEAKLEAKSRAR